MWIRGSCKTHIRLVWNQSLYFTQVDQNSAWWSFTIIVCTKLHLSQNKILQTLIFITFSVINAVFVATWWISYTEFDIVSERSQLVWSFYLLLQTAALRIEKAFCLKKTPFALKVEVYTHFNKNCHKCEKVLFFVRNQIVSWNIFMSKRLSPIKYMWIDAEYHCFYSRQTTPWMKQSQINRLKKQTCHKLDLSVLRSYRKTNSNAQWKL